MGNNPEQLEQKALSLLNQLPAFQTFMKKNSQLAGLFHVPGNYGSSGSLSGLQTKEQVAQQIQAQGKGGGPGTSGGSGGTAALPPPFQSPNAQLAPSNTKPTPLGTAN